MSGLEEVSAAGNAQGMTTPSGGSERPQETSHNSDPSYSDDVWLEPENHPEDAGEYADAVRGAMTQDVHRLRTTHTTAGYREGFAASREAAVQPGFDEGHLLGAALGIRAGYLCGVIEGLEQGIYTADMNEASRATVELQLKQTKQDLQLQNLLGQQWIDVDGTWKWKVEGPYRAEQPTIGVIANAHPVILRANHFIGTCCRVLGIERNDST